MVERQDNQLLAIAYREFMAFELGQRVVAFKIDIGAKCLFLKPGFDMPVERIVCGHAVGLEQEVIGEKRLLAFLLFRLADQRVEHTGIVVDVAVVDVVGQRFLMDQRLALEFHPLRHGKKPPNAPRPLSAASAPAHLLIAHRA